MPLPKLESTKYTTQIPSTKEEIEFRPFLVKEEKILMIAQESEDEKQIMSAMKEIVSACTFGEVNADECTLYDIEYLFLQLRMKSIGETATINLKCDKCGKYTPVEIDLNEVKVVFPVNDLTANREKGLLEKRCNSFQFYLVFVSIMFACELDCVF